MRKILILTVATMVTMNLMAQDSTKLAEKPVDVKISGFIMNNMFFDTRRNVDAIDGMVLLYPLPEAKNSLDVDFNKFPNLTLLSFASRLIFGISGPNAFGAKTSGLIELDFTSRANSATVRFRQAWVKLNWEKTELLIGRTWHPICSMDVIPTVMAMSVGAPFQPFNRSEQISLTHKIGKVNLVFSALFQNDYTNNGPVGKSSTYQNNAIVPNLHAQVKYKTENAILGVGVDYKRLKPRTYVESPVDRTKMKTDAVIDCPSIVAYAQVTSGKLTISGKSILAANISESLMTGAYGISSYNALTGYEEYTNFRHFFVWSNVSYGDKLKYSLFTGYLKNLGAGENIIAPFNSSPTVFGLGENIGQLIRITPTVSYTVGKTIIALELEHNIAGYGTIDYMNKGKIVNTSSVNGTRILATMFYNF
jgi:hypothetical protein